MIRLRDDWFGLNLILEDKSMINRKWQIITLALLAMLVLVACQPETVEVTRVVTQTETQQVEVTRIVEGEVVTEIQEVEVEVTREVISEVEVEVTAVPAQVQDVIYALYQEPQILNPEIATQTASGEVSAAIVEGLLQPAANGEYIPELATEVPTEENGGVVYDAETDILVVTYHLREDVLWSDGKPFTCDDVLFTWEAIVHPESGAVSTSGYDQISSVECPDEYTVVVTYDPFFAPWLGRFTDIMPRHATGDPADMEKWPWNWNLVGTGPFRMTEWVPGDHITLVKNENYRFYPEKPHLDRLVIRITPSREAGKAMIQTGEVDFLWDLTEFDLPDLEGKPGVVLNVAPGVGTERLVLNLADPALDATDDPLNNPHPLLGDLNVRKAIEAAINKDEINEVLLFGAATVGTREVNVGPFAEGCEIAASVYDPDAAMALLDEAGFTDEDGDGIRECNGCQFANPGDPLRLKIQTTTGNQLREQAEQLLIEYMADVGIDMYIENVPSSVLFASWSSGAFRKHGQYDVLMYTTSESIDPHSQINGYFGADKIPTEENGGSGFNYSRWVNMDADAAIKAAGATPNISERVELYCTAMQYIADELPHIYLYDRAAADATSDKLTGYVVNIWDYTTWDVDEWQMSE
jgi:peptide/nickel transport system substrate-binding protein